MRGLMQASRRYRASAEEAEAALQGMVTAGMGHWRNITLPLEVVAQHAFSPSVTAVTVTEPPKNPGNGEVPLPLPSDKTKPAAPTGLAARLREAGF